MVWMGDKADPESDHYNDDIFSADEEAEYMWMPGYLKEPQFVWMFFGNVAFDPDRM